MNNSRGPGFRFSKTGPVPTQWAIPACLPDVTYKRVSTGEGPGSAMILPVNHEKAEEDLAKLMVQMNLPNKDTKIARSWAQTQFLADHDPYLNLTGSQSRQSVSSSGMRSIEATRSSSPQSNIYKQHLDMNDDNTNTNIYRTQQQPPFETIQTFSDTIHDGSSSVGGDDSGMSHLAKHMMDEWQPPAVFSKRPVTPKIHASIVRAQPNDWTLVNHEGQEKNLNNNNVYGDNNRDIAILNYYNQRAATADAANADKRHRQQQGRQLKSAPTKRDSKFYERLQSKSNRMVCNFDYCSHIIYSVRISYYCNISFHSDIFMIILCKSAQDGKCSFAVFIRRLHPSY